MKTPTFILERQLDKLAIASLLKFQDGIKNASRIESAFTVTSVPFTDGFQPPPGATLESFIHHLPTLIVRY